MSLQLTGRDNSLLSNNAKVMRRQVRGAGRRASIVRIAVLHKDWRIRTKPGWHSAPQSPFHNRVAAHIISAIGTRVNLKHSSSKSIGYQAAWQVIAWGIFPAHRRNHCGGCGRVSDFSHIAHSHANAPAARCSTSRNGYAAVQRFMSGN